MKRFTETTKWQDPWYRKLSPRLKCLWQYLCDACDHAGVLDFDPEIAAFSIGETIVESDIAAMGERVKKLASGKLYVVRFIEFQFGRLSHDCRPHKVVFEAIARNGLKYPTNTLPDRVSDNPQDKDQDKDKDKEKGVKGETKPSEEEISAYCQELSLPPSDAAYCFNKWESNGWVNGRHKIKNWRATIRSWKAAGYMPSQNHKNGTHPKHASGRNAGTANEGVSSQYRGVGQ